MDAFVVPPDNSADDDDDPSQERPHAMDVEGRLTALEEALADLQTEVITRRLVVQDEGGRPRIVGEVVDGVTELRLSTGNHTEIPIFAAEGTEATGFTTSIGVQLWIEGEEMTGLSAWSSPDGEWRAELHPPRTEV